jgi:hypothetical protein
MPPTLDGRQHGHVVGGRRDVQDELGREISMQKGKGRANVAGAVRSARDGREKNLEAI